MRHALVDLHISDLLNAQIPSTFDYTSDYDVMLFRRLDLPPPPGTGSATRRPPCSAPLLKNLDTAPVGFAVFDQLLRASTPARAPVRAHHVQRLLAPGTTPEKRAGSRLPASSADLMLRQLDLMVDGFLSLRRDISKPIDQWQMALLNPNSHFHWGKVLQAQLGLHQLNEICEDRARASRRTGSTCWKAGPRKARRPSAARASCCACARATCWNTLSASATTCTAWS